MNVNNKPDLKVAKGKDNIPAPSTAVVKLNMLPMKK
jgi:hypothetical protein